MLSMISRTIGATISVALMVIGARVVAQHLWSWKKAHDSHHPQNP